LGISVDLIFCFKERKKENVFKLFQLMLISGVYNMSARIRKAVKSDRIKAAGLSLMLLAGPLGCAAGSAKMIMPAKVAPRSQAAAKSPHSENHVPKLKADKASIRKEVRQIESEMILLYAQKSLFELNQVLAGLVKSREGMDIGGLEPLGIKGAELGARLNDGLKKRNMVSGDLEALSDQANGLCSMVRSGFDQARVQELARLEGEIDQLRKKERDLSGNVIRRVRFRRQIASIRKKVKELDARKSRIEQMNGQLGTDIQKFAQGLAQAKDELAGLKAALDEIDALENSSYIRMRIGWLRSLRQLQEKRGIDSSGTDNELAQAQAMIRKMESTGAQKK